jgi:hypothetical protein
MPELATKLELNGSPADAVRAFVGEGGLPQERAGYILARFAMTLVPNNNGATEYIDQALHQLSDDETAQLHQPPLSDELIDMSKQYLVATEGKTGPFGHGMLKGQVTSLLLSMIIDHGTRPDGLNNA